MASQSYFIVLTVRTCDVQNHDRLPPVWSSLKLTPIRLVFIAYIKAMASPINNNIYNCHIKAVELFNQSMGFIPCHITSLVINSLGDRYTHVQRSGPHSQFGSLLWHHFTSRGFTWLVKLTLASEGSEHA